MKNIITFKKYFESKNKVNEGSVELFMAGVTLLGLTNLGYWATENIKYWTSKHGRYFKALEKDKEFFKQFVELLTTYGKGDPTQAFRYIFRGLGFEKKKFIDEIFELPRALEIREKLGISDDPDSTMWKVKYDFNDALINGYVERFIVKKLKSIKRDINESKNKFPDVKKMDIDGFIVYIGKDAKSNDYLTFNMADDEDIWMHAKGVPGSHVVIRVMDNLPTETTIKKVAELAKKNSKAKRETNVPVVYCQRKFVKKEPGMNDGQVKVDYINSNDINI